MHDYIKVNNGLRSKKPMAFPPGISQLVDRNDTKEKALSLWRSFMKKKILLCTMLILMMLLVGRQNVVKAATIDISTAAQLRSLATEVNNGTSHQGDTINLTADINLGGSSSAWTPIGKLSKPFNGTFNGNNHTISGLYINNTVLSYAGLFGYVGSQGIIKNVTVSGSITAGDFVGGIAGRSYGTITNCTNNASITRKSWTCGRNSRMC